MTPDEIKAAYTAVIGDMATSQLANAGLLPTVEELDWRIASRTTTDTSDNVSYVRTHRYTTMWTDVPS